MDDADKPTNSKGAPVGYGNPPEGTRFKKGKSGNPRGRPKGTLNLATALKKSFRQKVVITENGRRKTITKLEAAFRQLVNLAAAGDLRAIQQLSALARSVQEQPNEQASQQTELGDADQKVLDNIVRRFSKEK